MEITGNTVSLCKLPLLSQSILSKLEWQRMQMIHIVVIHKIQRPDGK
jgi:hypothetical protein